MQGGASCKAAAAVAMRLGLARASPPAIPKLRQVGGSEWAEGAPMSDVQPTTGRKADLAFRPSFRPMQSQGRHVQRVLLQWQSYNLPCTSYIQHSWLGLVCGLYS